MNIFTRTIFIFTLIFVPVVVLAETHVSGDLTEDTVWDSTHSPYMLVGDYKVLPNVTLTILPGVQIQMGDIQESSLVVEGKIVAHGTKENPILFQKGLNNLFLRDAGAELSNVIFQNGVYGLVADNSVVSITDFVVASTTNSGFVFNNSNVFLNNGVVYQGDQGIGISTHGSSVEVGRLNLFASSTYPSIEARKSSLKINSSQLIGDQNTSSIEIYNSALMVGSTTISNFDTGVYSVSSSFDIQNSSFLHNREGIFVVKPASGSVGYTQYGIGGEGNLFDSIDSNHLMIRQSVFENNTEKDITNSNTLAIDAVSNWWGTAAGPGLKVSGNASVSPWLMTDPRIQQEQCCSNVLFIPGFQGSRLYINEQNQRGIDVNTLWEPNRNDDVRKLFMNSTTSAHVYTRDIVDTVGLNSSIYGDFQKFLDGLVQERSIKKWDSFPYDWRYGIRDVVQNGATTTLGKKYLTTVLDALASSSPNGKVSIVAHSNGGLVTKYLLQSLIGSPLMQLIDKIIFVGVPELGTPKAIASLLHGYDQAIGGGLFLKKAVARDFGNGLPGAYGLLPSREYFSQNTASVISIATSVPKTTALRRASTNINSYSGMFNFLSGKEGRSKPDSKDLVTPTILSQNLLSLVDDIHRRINAFSISPSIQVSRIIGTGLNTVSGVVYSGEDDCGTISLLSRDCRNKKLVTNIAMTSYGDGTVVSGSARGASTTQIKDNPKYFVDLMKIRKKEGSSIDHATLLNSKTILDLVKNILISSSTASTITYDRDSVSLDEPNFENRQQLIVRVHSPADIHVYDTLGRHVGILPNSDPESSDIIRAETQIPESEYFNPGEEGQFVILPYGEQYQVEIRGNGVGTFSVTAERSIGNTIFSKSEFVDMPITPLTVARFTPATSLTATTVATALSIDVDGNGITDVVVPNSKELDIQSHIELIKKTLAQLDISPIVRKTIEIRLNFVVQQMNRNRSRFNQWMLQNVVRGITFSRSVFRKVSTEDKKQIINLLDTLIQALERSAEKSTN